MQLEVFEVGGNMLLVALHAIDVQSVLLAESGFRHALPHE